MKLCTLSTGDGVYRFYNNILVLFEGPRHILSTSILNGGYRQDLTAVFNNDCRAGAGMPCVLKAPVYQEHLRLVAAELGVDADHATGMSTAASMDNVAIITRVHQDLTVTALATGGIDVNGGRAGDPADHYQPGRGSLAEPAGTINIILHIDADLPPGILTRALVTCTEAKTAALQELMAGSNYSTGLATGSGTDSTVVIANPAAPLHFEYAGKHSKLGELIGQAVICAVKEALLKQSGLSPERQHSVLQRFKRFGVQAESLWLCYQGCARLPASKARFMEALHQLDGRPDLVVDSSLYIHLIDQRIWRLLSPQQAAEAGDRLLKLTAAVYNVAPVSICGYEISDFTAAWQYMLIAILERRLEEN